MERFYEVDRLGDPIPDGPLLVVANHPNSLMDALVILKVAGRRVRPLAKAPLFESPVFRPVLRGLGALPVYRPQDYPGETWRNEDTFGAAVMALRQGEAVLIFPEGLSHSESRLARLKTGAARIALEAEESSGWRLDLRIVPVGLTYDRKHAFRGRVVAARGAALEVARWRRSREQEEWPAVESLTDAVREALERVTLNLSSRDDRELLETAESLYATEKGLAEPRSRPGLAPRLPRLQRFAEALAWLQLAEPDHYESLAASVRSYRQQLAAFGVREGELPARLPPAAVARYLVRHGGPLLLGLPFAALGTVVWYLPFMSPRASINLYRPPYEAIASLKLGTALVAFPVIFTLYLSAAWWLWGPLAALALAVVLPVAGLVALRWRDRWQRVREDARVFWSCLRQRTLRAEMVARRRALVAEFDRLVRRWAAERRSRRG